MAWVDSGDDDYVEAPQHAERRRPGIRSRGGGRSWVDSSRRSSTRRRTVPARRYCPRQDGEHQHDAASVGVVQRARVGRWSTGLAPPQRRPTAPTAQERGQFDTDCPNRRRAERPPGSAGSLQSTTSRTADAHEGSRNSGIDNSGDSRGADGGTDASNHPAKTTTATESDQVPWPPGVEPAPFAGHYLRTFAQRFLPCRWPRAGRVNQPGTSGLCAARPGVPNSCAPRSCPTALGRRDSHLIPRHHVGHALQREQALRASRRSPGTRLGTTDQRGYPPGRGSIPPPATWSRC